MANILKTAIDVQIQVNRMTLDLRAIDRLIQSELFTYYWQASWDREPLLKAVKDMDLEGVKEWFAKTRKQKIQDLPVRDLIQLCRKHRIANYSRMQKHEMVEALDGQT